MCGKNRGVNFSSRHVHENANGTSILILGQRQKQVCGIGGLRYVSLTTNDMAQLQKTDIDVGGDRMAMKKAGCAVVFSQPSCRTVETRRPGPGWLTTTFGMEDSLHQSWVYEQHESQWLLSETSATCDLMVVRMMNVQRLLVEGVSGGVVAISGRGSQRLPFSVFWACQALSILVVLRIATLSTLFCSPILLFACENNTRPNDTLVDFIRSPQRHEQSDHTAPQI